MPWDSHSADTGKGKLGKYGPLLPAGSSPPGAVVLLVAVVMAALLAFYAFTFRVNPDELGVVMRFGKVARQEPPGLHFRLPYPIDEVRLPKVTRQNIVEVGMRTGEATRIGSAGGVTYVREESLMLTGDENIVDVNFVVYWRIQDPLKYLFSIQNPEITVKDVAESAMREVVGQSEIQPILTGGRQKTEQAVQTLMQERARSLWRRHPRRSGAAAEDRSAKPGHRRVPRRASGGRRQGEAAERGVLLRQPRSFRRRAATPSASCRAPRATSSRRSLKPTGQTARFLKIQEEYKKAPDVTRTRLYLETMERVFGSADKIIIDSNTGVVPYLSLAPSQKRKDGGN